jgi:hypothetical protein
MTDIEVIENLEALAALTGDNEGILRAAIDRIKQLEAGLREIADYDFPGTLRWSELVAEIKAIARALLKGQS